MYTCTGNPHPTDIADIMSSMMNDSFETSYRRSSALSLLHHADDDAGISTLKADKGLALQDILSGLYDYVATIELSGPTRIYLLDQLAQVEHRLSTGGSEKLQLTALLGATKMYVIFISCCWTRADLAPVRSRSWPRNDERFLSSVQ